MTPAEKKDLSARVRRVGRDNELLRILDRGPLSGSDWGLGACWTFAATLSQALRAGSLWAAYRDGEVQHIVLKLDVDTFADSLGLRSGRAVLRDLAKHERVGHWTLAPWSPTQTASAEIGHCYRGTLMKSLVERTREMLSRSVP